MRTRLLALLFFPALARADAIDEIVRAEMKRTKTPGVAIAVMRNGKPIKIKGYGYANLEHRVPVKPETIFQSGSVGKQFTSTLVMMLVKDKKIGLDDDITKYLQESKGKWEGVKVRQLLSHTSGLPDLPYGRMDMRKDYTEEELVKYMLDQSIPKKPGTEWRYNNGGYVMLGVIVRRATGRFYGDLLRERIFKPLGMSTARIISEDDIVMNRAAGYVPTRNGVRNQDWVAPRLNTTADGALYMTVLDMAKWDAALYTEKLLPRSMLLQMWTPVKVEGAQASGLSMGGYGFGWGISRPNGQTLIHHAGGWQGFTSYIGRLVDKRLTVVVFCNLSEGQSSKIGQLILESYVPSLKQK